MFRFQKKKTPRSLIVDAEKSVQESIPVDFWGELEPSPARRAAYERIGTNWRKLLGDQTFLDIVAEQGIDGE